MWRWRRKAKNLSCGNERKGNKASYIVHKLRGNCLLNHFSVGKIEGGIAMTRRRGRRSKHQLYVVMEKRRDWKLKEEELDRNVWRTRFGTG
jgi:hypothetical protein